MACRRIEELDLSGFLENPNGEEFQTFRAHYPGCADCASEVRVWTELHLELSNDASQHPSPETLLQFLDDPGALPPEDRVHIQQHLSSCAGCTEELRAAEAFDAGRKDDVEDAASPIAVAGAPAMSFAPPSLDRTDVEEALGRIVHADREELEALVTSKMEQPAPALEADSPAAQRPSSRIGRILWSPGFAYAALLAVTLPLLYVRRDVVVEPVRQSVSAERVPTRLRALGESNDASRSRKRAPLEKPRSALAEEMSVEALGAAAPPAAAPLAAKALAPPQADFADLDGRLEPILHGNELRVALPAPTQRTTEDTDRSIEVTTPDGRQLTQPLPRSEDGRPIEVTLPADWLGPGVQHIRVLEDGIVVARFTIKSPERDGTE